MKSKKGYKMKVRAYSIGSNMTEALIGSNRFLISYHTPVAAYIDGEGYFRTSRKWSSTTSKHINKWLQGVAAKEISQTDLEAMLEVA